MTRATTNTEIAKQLLGTISSDQLITLFLERAMQQINRAVSCVGIDNLDLAIELTKKIVATTDSLKDSLNRNIEDEGLINLNALYGYVIVRFDAIAMEEEPTIILEEVRQLVSEICTDWVSLVKEALTVK